METTRDFGEVSIDLGCATRDDVGAARAEQRGLARRGHRIFLAELLLARGTISAEQQVRILERASGYGEAPKGEAPARSGGVLVRKGYVSPLQLYRALQAQRDEDAAARPHRPIGEILVERGHLTRWELDDALEAQALDEAFPAAPELDGGGVLYARHYSTVPPYATILVRDAMSPAVKATPASSLGAVLDRLEENESQVALVIQWGLLLGLVDLWEVRDLDRRVAVGRLMRPPAPTVSAETTIGEAARILRESGAPSLPAISRGVPVGVVTADDVRQAGVPRDELDLAIPYEELGGGD